MRLIDELRYAFYRARLAVKARLSCWIRRRMRDTRSHRLVNQNHKPAMRSRQRGDKPGDERRQARGTFMGSQESRSTVFRYSCDLLDTTTAVPRPCL
jgi:hypothetical protein